MLQKFSQIYSLFKKTSASPAVYGKFPNNKAANLKDSDFMVESTELETSTNKADPFYLYKSSIASFLDYIKSIPKKLTQYLS